MKSEPTGEKYALDNKKSEAQRQQISKEGQLESQTESMEWEKTKTQDTSCLRKRKSKGDENKTDDCLWHQGKLDDAEGVDKRRIKRCSEISTDAWESRVAASHEMLYWSHHET